MTVTNFTIASGNDEAVQAGDGGAVSVNQNPMSLRNNSNSANRRHVGLRFTPPTTGDLPKGVTINSATLSTYSSHASLDDANSYVYGHDVDTSQSFETGTGDNTVDSRTRTTASALYTISNAVIDTQQTLNVTAIVQEIVDRSGWDEVCITLLGIGDGTGSEYYQFYGYGGTSPPTLSVDWSTPPDRDVSKSESLTVGESSRTRVITFGGTNTPSIALNTADAHVFQTLTPTVEFTGDDPDPGEYLRYHIQIAENSAFTSNSAAADEFLSGGGSLTIHAQPGASETTWMGEIAVDDRPGQSFTGQGGQLDQIKIRMVNDQGDSNYPDGTARIRVYAHEGTFGTSSAPLNPASPANTPTPDWLAVSDDYVLDNTMSTSTLWYTFTFSGLNRIVLQNGVHYVFIMDWVPSDRVTTNTFGVAGDTTGTNHNGNVYVDGFAVANNGPHPWDLYFEVDEAEVLIDRISGTDGGFVNTVDAGDPDPFKDADKIGFTPVLELADVKTYYWHVQVKDPYGSDTYSSYASYRTFIVDLTGIYASASDNVAVGDSVTVAMADEAVNVSDSVTVADSPSIEFPSDANVTDNVAVGETLTLDLTIEIGVSDGVALVDDVSVVLISYVSVSDGLTIDESVSIEFSTLAVVSDAVAVGETRSVDLQIDVDVNDAIAVGESVSATMTDEIVSVSDSLNIGETSSVELITEVSVADSIVVGETTSEVISDLAINVSDALTVDDSVSVLIVIEGLLYVSVSDGVSLADNTILFEDDHMIVVSDDLTLADTAIAAGEALTINISDGVAVSETVTVVRVGSDDLLIVKSETISVSEAVNLAMFALSINCQDSVVVGETVYGGVGTINDTYFKAMWRGIRRQMNV